MAKSSHPCPPPNAPTGVKLLPEPVALVAEGEHGCTVFRPSSNTTNGFTGTWSPDVFTLGYSCLLVRVQEVYGQSAATQEQTEHCTDGAAQDVKLKKTDKNLDGWTVCCAKSSVGQNKKSQMGVLRKIKPAEGVMLGCT